ncbi:hypothetical protein B0H34DRAFT_524292 [Crassisporium funariophilum]|nr:hypothetical protein B0H34DRAFT_524292 [Crassisporium funariophilum]
MKAHTLLLASLMFGIQHVMSAVITLYDIVPPSEPIPTKAILRTFDQFGTTIVSAIGPGAESMTRYERKFIRTLAVAHDASTTVSVTAPATYTYTFEQGAALHQASNPPALETGVFGQIIFMGVSQKCTLDVANKNGQCVEERQVPALIRTGGDNSAPLFKTVQGSVFTTTYAGSLTPMATITTSGIAGHGVNVAAVLAVLTGLGLGVLAVI